MNPQQTPSDPPVTPVAAPPAPAPTPTPPSMPSQKRSNKLWIVIGSIVIVLALLAGGLWWWVNTVRGDYAKKAAGYEQTVRTAYEYYRDDSSPSTHITPITNHFTSALNAKPTAPQLFGWNLAADTDQSKVNSLADHLTKLRDSYKNYHAFQDFGVAVLKTMATVTGTINTPADMQAKKTEFTKVINDLKAISVVSGSEDYMQKTIAAYQSVVTDLTDGLNALHDKDDGGYLIAINRLQTDILDIGIAHAGPELTTLNENYFNTMIKAYNDLGTLLHEDR